MGQYICPHPDYDFIDPKTQQPRGCTKENKAKVLCLVADGLVCTETKNNTFKKDIPCKWTNGYSFETSLLLSIFLGMFGADRFYLGYPALGLLKLSTLGFLFLGQFADHIDAEESTVKLQVFRHRRAINPATVLRYCKLNQYYDQEEGRCLGVPGGGKVLHVENGRSCGVNILKPHCTSLLYYHICKRDKSILAQCSSRQIFDNRLQRCAYYDSSSLTPSIIRPDDREYYEHLVGVPNCTRPGRFPVPDHCSMFYTCDTNGHRLHQSVFKCPRNTGYQATREVCAVVSDCENNDSVDSAVCVPDAPGENVESLNSDDATETNVEGTTETSEESETRSVNDFASKKEESLNSKTYDNIISTTSESITDNPLSEDNYGGNDGDLDKASALSTQPIQDISVSDSTGEILNQAVNPTESAREVQNEKEDSISPLDLQITSPPTVELDAPHSVMTPTTLTPVYSTDINSNVDSEIADTPFSTVSYRSSKLDERTLDITTEQYRSNDDGTVTLPNSNTEALDPYSASTVSNVPEFPPISETSSKLYEETRDVTGAVDSYQTSTISTVPESSPIIDTPLDEKMQDTTTDEYRNNDETVLNSNTEAIDPYSASTISNVSEFPPNSETSSKLYEETRDVTGAVDSYQTSTISNIPESSPIIDTPSKLDEETQDTTTDEYRNNDDETVLNSNTEAIDPYSASTISNVPEFPPISETSSKLYEETQSATTEQYGNDDRIMTPSNSNPEMINQNPTSILSDISATTDSPSNDFDTSPSTLTSAILSPQTDINDDQYATKELFTSPSVDSKLVDTDLDAPEAIENVSTGYSSKHTDTLDLATTESTLTQDHIPASMDITTIIPTKQDFPAISDTDLMTQN
ncbi:tm2 domain-containing protein, partial [Lasius niger]